MPKYCTTRKTMSRAFTVTPPPPIIIYTGWPYFYSSAHLSDFNPFHIGLSRVVHICSSLPRTKHPEVHIIYRSFHGTIYNIKRIHVHSDVLCAAYSMYNKQYFFVPRLMCLYTPDPNYFITRRGILFFFHPSGAHNGSEEKKIVLS